jgi:hypothetical protein
MLIEPLQVAPGPPAVLRRRGPFPPSAHGIDASRDYIRPHDIRTVGCACDTLAFR